MKKPTPAELLQRELQDLKQELNTETQRLSRVSAAAVRLGTAIQLLAKSQSSPENK